MWIFTCRKRIFLGSVKWTALSRLNQLPVLLDTYKSSSIDIPKRCYGVEGKLFARKCSASRVCALETLSIVQLSAGKGVYNKTVLFSCSISARNDARHNNSQHVIIVCVNKKVKITLARSVSTGTNSYLNVRLNSVRRNSVQSDACRHWALVVSKRLVAVRVCSRRLRRVACTSIVKMKRAVVWNRDWFFFFSSSSSNSSHCRPQLAALLLAAAVCSSSSMQQQQYAAAAVCSSSATQQRRWNELLCNVLYIVALCWIYKAEGELKFWRQWQLA